MGRPLGSCTAPHVRTAPADSRMSVRGTARSSEPALSAAAGAGGAPPLAFDSSCGAADSGTGPGFTCLPRMVSPPGGGDGAGAGIDCGKNARAGPGKGVASLPERRTSCIRLGGAAFSVRSAA